ncbi:MAG: hypothetical protein HY609_07015 [Deltaproteobacteria bacterium]|nr:hypothetical protein [Deltaproteobacteria bacterium]MBI4224670.1 hypothetical protein [Deltaproteobacteria bacterium]
MRKWNSGLIVLCLLSVCLPAQAGYRSVLNKWTKSKQMYAVTDVHAKAIWHATYFSPEFRRAKAERHTKKKYLEPVEAAQYIAAEEKKQAEAHEFFVGIYTRKPYRHITSGSDSFWEMVLTTEAGEVLSPTLVEPVGVHPYEEVMYPYLNRWSKGYRVVFPKAPLGDSFRLTLRSVVGKSTLKWSP